MKSLLWLLLLFPLCFFSCKPQQKLPNYLQNVSDTTGGDAIKFPELRIQKNDLLSIQIHSSSTKPELSDLPYNEFIVTATTVGSVSIPTTGYLVDVDGNIEHHRPEIGTIHAEGLTKKQLAAEIKKRLTVPVELLKDPTVVIRFLNYKVTVLGEVAKPGSITVPTERITIFEAIGLAGDITPYGLKNSVRVIRDIDGQSEIATVDLTSKDIFTSRFYNLLQNDVVSVTASEKRARIEEQSLIAQKTSMALSIATIALSIVQIFR